MSKLSKKDLLEYFDDMCLFLANHHWTKRDERAVAIREMIQKSGELSQKRALTVDEIISKYPMSIRILLVQLVAQIDRLQKKPLEKPKITARFITKHAKIFVGLAETNAPLKIYKDFVTGLIKEIEEKMEEAK